MVEEVLRDIMDDRGLTVLELMVGVSIIAVLVALAAPTLYSNLISSGKVGSAASNLYDDIKWAQSEAQKQGSMDIEWVEMPPGSGNWGWGLRQRGVFVVFDETNNSYSIWRWEDKDGDNLPEAGELAPDFNNSNNDGAIKTVTLDNNVTFGFGSDVNKKACSNGAGAPSGPIINVSTSMGLPPCYGLPCIQFDAKGFIKGQTGDIVIYLTNNSHTYAVTADSIAGIFKMCKWVADTWQYTLK